jgi:hypothetical protein
MFGIQKCGTFLTVGINLVVCGAIVYYFHKRVSSLENALLKQNQVFSSFMAEMVQKTRQQGQAQHVQGQHVQGGELAAPEALAAASKFVSMQKIEVSDDESSSSSSSDDDESESSSDEEESGSEDEKDIKKIKLSNFDISEDHINSEEMLMSSMTNNFMMLQPEDMMLHTEDSMSGSFIFINGHPTMLNSNDLLSLSAASGFAMPVFEEIRDLEETKKVIILNDSSSESDSDSDDEDETKITVLKKQESRTPPRSPILLQIESLNDGEEEPVKIIKSEDFEDTIKSEVNKKAPKKNIVVMDMETGSLTMPADAAANAAEKDDKLENMKIDDLRKNVVLKNLAGKEEVKKMKKPELIALLKK